MCVGDRVCVTRLRVCHLRSWRGNSILAVTDASEILTHSPRAHGEDASAGSQQDTPPAVMMSSVDDAAEAEPQRSSTHTTRTKRSRVINYQVSRRC